MDSESNACDQCIAWKSVHGVGLELHSVADPIQLLKSLSVKHAIRWFSLSGEYVDEALVDFVSQLGTVESLHIIGSVPSGEMFRKLLIQSAINQVTSSDQEILKWMRCEVAKTGLSVSVEESL